MLQGARRILSLFLRLDDIPPLQAELPPRLKSSKCIPVLAHRLIDISFPGAYVRFHDDENSTVDFHVFEGAGKTNLMLGCGSTSTSASDLLAAALAASSAQCMDSMIIDAGLHWTRQEETKAAEPINRLSIQQQQTDFATALEYFRRGLAVHQRPS